MRLLMIGILATALVAGCSKDKTHSKSGHDHSMHAADGMHAKDGMHDSHEGHDQGMHKMAGAHAGHDHGKGHMATGSKVTVPKAGHKFKPPVKPAQLPDGVWYCDMGGSVHYARGTKGDGKCPLCHMKLHHKVASK